MSPFLTVLLFVCLFSVFSVFLQLIWSLFFCRRLFFTLCFVFLLSFLFLFLKLCPNSGSTFIVVVVVVGGVALFWGFWVGGNIGIEVNEQNLCYYSRFTVAVLPYKHFYFRSTISS